MSNALRDYLDRLTPEEKELFASRAESSAASLRLAAMGYKTAGRLSISPDFAARLEAASNGALKREHMAPVCAVCPYVCKN